jgi:hypothetical protein
MKTFLIIALALVPALAEAHSNFLGPVPRNGVANKGPNGGATAPTAVNGSCGIDQATGLDVMRTGTQTTTTYQPGQMINFTWAETISHAGYFQIWFSPNADDSNMVLLTGGDMLYQHAAGTPQNYSIQIAAPTQQCAQCVFRLIQVMLDNPTVPTYYYSCANITISTNVTPPNPAPAPAPQPCP